MAGVIDMDTILILAFAVLGLISIGLSICLCLCSCKRRTLEKEIAFLKEFTKDNEQLIQALKLTEGKYNAVSKNFKRFKADGIYDDNAFYTKDDTPFIVLRRNIIYGNITLQGDSHSWTVAAVNISGSSASWEPRSEVCTAQVSAYTLGKRIFICSLDTSELYEREGHGSHILEHLKSFAIRHKYAKIHGELPNETRIGLENLKRFYRKNGFTIKGKVFFWENEALPSMGE